MKFHISSRLILLVGSFALLLLGAGASTLPDGSSLGVTNTNGLLEGKLKRAALVLPKFGKPDSTDPFTSDGDPFSPNEDPFSPYYSNNDPSKPEDSQPFPENDPSKPKVSDDDPSKPKSADAGTSIHPQTKTEQASTTGTSVSTEETVTPSPSTSKTSDSGEIDSGPTPSSSASTVVSTTLSSTTGTEKATIAGNAQPTTLQFSGQCKGAIMSLMVTTMWTLTVLVLSFGF